MHQNQDFGRTPRALPGGSKGDSVLSASSGCWQSFASSHITPVSASVHSSFHSSVCVSDLPLPVSHKDMCGVTFRTQPDDRGRIISPHQHSQLNHTCKDLFPDKGTPTGSGDVDMSLGAIVR